jgi:hypothetical protein
MVVGKEVESAAKVWDVMKWLAATHGKGRYRNGLLGSRSKESSAFRCGGISAALTVRSNAACLSAFRIRSEQLLEKIRVELDAGYKRIKIKISPRGITM